MKGQSLWILAAISTAAAAVGLSCGEAIDSSDIATSGVYADLRATATGDGNTQIDVKLRSGGATSNTLLELSEGDDLQVKADGQMYQTHVVDLAVTDAVFYRAMADTDVGGTTVEVAFTRQDFDDAPDSSVTLPDRFTIDAPAADSTFSRSADDVAVKLSHAATSAKQVVTVTGPCITPYRQELDAGASLTIPAGTLEAQTPEHDDDSCTATVLVRRVNNGTVDSAYGEGGHFEALQKRSVQFTIDP